MNIPNLTETAINENDTSNKRHKTDPTTSPNPEFPLPYELLMHLLTFLPPDEMSQKKLVSRQLARAVKMIETSPLYTPYWRLFSKIFFPESYSAIRLPEKEENWTLFFKNQTTYRQNFLKSKHSSIQRLLHRGDVRCYNAFMVRDRGTLATVNCFSIKIWDIENESPSVKYHLHVGIHVIALAMEDDVVCVLTSDHRILIWKLKNEISFEPRPSTYIKKLPELHLERLKLIDGKLFCRNDTQLLVIHTKEIVGAELEFNQIVSRVNIDSIIGKYENKWIGLQNESLVILNDDTFEVASTIEHEKGYKITSICLQEHRIVALLQRSTDTLSGWEYLPFVYDLNLKINLTANLFRETFKISSNLIYATQIYKNNFFCCEGIKPKYAFNALTGKTIPLHDKPNWNFFGRISRVINGIMLSKEFLVDMNNGTISYPSGFNIPDEDTYYEWIGSKLIRFTKAGWLSIADFK